MKHSTASNQKLITNSFRNQATEVRKNNLQRPLRSNLTLVTFQMCSSNGNNTYLLLMKSADFAAANHGEIHVPIVAKGNCLRIIWLPII